MPKGGRFQHPLLEIKDNNISLSYIKYKLEPILREVAKGRKGEKGENEFTKVYPSMLENIKIKIPIDQTGKFDLQAQKEIAGKYQKIEGIKSAINLELDKISETEVEL